MNIRIDPVTLVGRGYAPGQSYDSRDPYRLVFTVFLNGSGEAYMYAMHGELTLDDMFIIGKELHEKYGVNQVKAERNGKVTVYDKRFQERAIRKLADHPPTSDLDLLPGAPNGQAPDAAASTVDSLAQVLPGQAREALDS